MTWPTKKLGEISQIRMGETLIKKDLTGEGIPVYSADSLEKPWGYTSRNKLKFPNGAIVIGARGTIGSLKLPEDPYFTSTQTTIVVEPNENGALPGFIFYFLDTLDFKKFTTGTGIPMITVGYLNTLKIPLPSLKIQKQIVEWLDKIAETQKLNDDLVQKADELFQSLLYKELNGKDWKVKKLEEIVDINYGKGLDKSYRKENGKYYAYGSNGPVYRTDKILIEELTIIIGRKGGVGLLWMTEEPSWPIDTTFYLRVKDGCNADLNFLYFSLQTKNLPKLAIVTAVPGINRSTLYNVKILLPPLKIQKQIVAKLSAVQDYKKQLLAQKSKLKELFDSVLSKSMKGELIK